MLIVQSAAFRRVLQRGDQRYAEVEVRTDRWRNPDFLAYFRKEGNGKFQLVRVMSTDADQEVDWFDNNLHAAYVDVTNQLFSGPNHASADDRHVFGRQIIAQEGVLEALEHSL